MAAKDIHGPRTDWTKWLTVICRVRSCSTIVCHCGSTLSFETGTVWLSSGCPQCRWTAGLHVLVMGLSGLPSCPRVLTQMHISPEVLPNSPDLPPWSALFIPTALKGHTLHDEENPLKRLPLTPDFHGIKGTGVAGSFPCFCLTQPAYTAGPSANTCRLARQLDHTIPFGDLRLHDSRFGYEHSESAMCWLKVWVSLIFWLNFKHNLCSSLNFMKTI